MFSATFFLLQLTWLHVHPRNPDEVDTQPMDFDTLSMDQMPLVLTNTHAPDEFSMLVLVPRMHCGSTSSSKGISNEIDFANTAQPASDDDDDDERKSVASTHVDELWYNLKHVFHFMDLRSSHMHPRIWQ
jgi:hypothetical protein